MSAIKSPVKKTTKSRRIPNPFMLFVKDQNRDLLHSCPVEEKATFGVHAGRKWRSMSKEEKQVYFDKFKVLKENQKSECDSNAAMEENENRKIGRCTGEDILLDNNCTFDQSFSTEQRFNKLTKQIESFDDLSMRPFAKQKTVKKARRPPNGFFIFAKEHRHSVKKDATSHESIMCVLGNMWRELPDSEKSKYSVEAKRLLTLHKKSETASETVPKRKKKMRSETVARKSIKHPLTRKKNIRDHISNNLQEQEAGETGKTEVASNSKKSLDKFEMHGNTNPSSDPLALNEYRNSTCLHQRNSSMNSLHHVPPPSEPHLSKACCCCQSASPSFHGCVNLKQNSLSGTGMPIPYYGSASFPPSFPSYPFIPSYPPPMAPRWFPFSSPSFCPFPYSYNLPYSHDSSYIGYYASQYGVIGSSAHATSKPTAPETATSASNENESTETKEKCEISEEEDLIVDEDPKEEHETVNGSA